MKIKQLAREIIRIVSICVVLGVSGKFYLEPKINSRKDMLNSLEKEFKEFRNQATKKLDGQDTYNFFKTMATSKNNDFHRLFLKESLRKYSYVLNKSYSSPKDYINKYPNRIWVYWDSGFENAPKIVKVCVANIEKHSSGRIVEKLDINNLDKYVKLPDYILRKFKEGKIDKAVFADIVRTVLLRDYGGTWIDATIYLSGNIPQYVFDSEIFAPINFDMKEKFFELRSHTVIGNYFMHVKEPYNYFFQCMSEFFFEYWKNMEGSDYHLWYSFAAVSSEEDPKICNMMYRLYQNPNCKPGHVIWEIQGVLLQPFNQSRWDKLKNSCPIHKISAKWFTNQKIDPGTFADKLLKGELK